MQRVTAEEARAWLVEKLAIRLGVDQDQIDAERYFDEFDLDSTEALILAGELEKWLGFELEATALWYHPTIAALSEHIAEESDRHVTPA
ncbi:acyl carrier protein [Streptomyces sp. NPDC057877]|uniref:acyl carrier protein n=1 Tax=Streptomyces sp. NPDC057877 TaxID=3346269 RepID=UPI00367C3420